MATLASSPPSQLTPASPPPVKEIMRGLGRGEKRSSLLADHSNLIRIVSVSLFLFLWELYAHRVDPIFLAPPTAILKAFWELLMSGELIRQTTSSLQSFLLGFTVAGLLGVAVGFAMGRYRIAEILLDPFINALYATPQVALIPLLMLWVGLGLVAKVTVVFLLVFFPVCINTVGGVKYVSSSYVDVVRSYGASEQQIFWKVIAPAALPFIVAGMRLAIGRGIVGMIVAEYFTAITGLGWMVINYSNTFVTDRLFVPIIMLALMGVGLTELVKFLEARLAPWKATERTVFAE